MARTIARNPDYSDLNLDFLPHPTTKDVVRLTGEDAIKRSVRNLILTNYYDRPFRSYIGSNVKKLLFDNPTAMTANYLIDAIKSVLTSFEPRISIMELKVTLSEDNNGFDVRLTYMILNRNQPVTINLFLERIR